MRLKKMLSSKCDAFAVEYDEILDSNDFMPFMQNFKTRQGSETRFIVSKPLLTIFGHLSYFITGIVLTAEMILARDGTE